MARTPAMPLPTTTRRWAIRPPPGRGRRSTVPVHPAGAATYSSSTVSASRSSTTRSATWVAPLAAIGKYRIGVPSRNSTTVIISFAGVAAAEVHRLGDGAGRHHVAQGVVDRHRLVVAVALELEGALQETGSAAVAHALEARARLFRVRFVRKTAVDPLVPHTPRRELTCSVRVSFHSRDIGAQRPRNGPAVNLEPWQLTRVRPRPVSAISSTGTPRTSRPGSRAARTSRNAT